jgi:D-amino-acid dehydrogenase
LHKHLAELGVQFSKTPDRWVGPRPTLPDYVPAIGRLKRAPKVLYAFGHAHLGLTECAITAEAIEALAADKPPPFDLAPFQIERFG